MILNTPEQVKKKHDELKGFPECQLFALTEEGSLTFSSPQQQILLAGDFLLVNGTGYAGGHGLSRLSRGVTLPDKEHPLSPLGLFTLNKLLLLHGDYNSAEYITRSRRMASADVRFFLAAHLPKALLLVLVDGRLQSHFRPLLLPPDTSHWASLVDMGLTVISAWHPEFFDDARSFFVDGVTPKTGVTSETAERGV